MRAARVFGRLFGPLVLVVLTASSCGAGDRANWDREVDELRSEVRRVVDDTKAEVAGNQGGTAASVQQILRRHVPGPPFGQVLALSGDNADGQARLGFAVRGKVDGYGPGHVTVSMRMCVALTMTPPPDLRTSIADTDCSKVAPESEAIVRFET